MRFFQPPLAPMIIVLLAPSLAFANSPECASAQAIISAMQSKLPIEVDAVTKTVTAKASCDKRQVRLSRSVDLKLSRMEADFKDFLQKQDNEFACTDKARKALIDAGWTWSTSYKFQEGNVVETKATCKK